MSPLGAQDGPQDGARRSRNSAQGVRKIGTLEQSIRKNKVCCTSSCVVLKRVFKVRCYLYHADVHFVPQKHIKMPLRCAALAAPSGYGGVVLNIFLEDGRQEAQETSKRP